MFLRADLAVDRTVWWCGNLVELDVNYFLPVYLNTFLSDYVIFCFWDSTIS